MINCVDKTAIGAEEPVSLFAIAAVQILKIEVCNTEVESSTIFRNQWRTEGGSTHPPSEIPKALQNRAKLNPIVNTVKNY